MDDYEEEEIFIPNEPSTGSTTTKTSKRPRAKEKFACKFCDRKFFCSRNCRLHVCSIHPDKFLLSAKLPNVSDHQFQIICFDFLSKHNWRKTNLIQFNYPYGCLYCEDNFRNSTSLKMHLINNHLEIIVNKLKELQSKLDDDDVTIIEFNEQYQSENNLEEAQNSTIPKQEDGEITDHSLETENLNKKTRVSKFERVRIYKCSHCEVSYLTVLSLTTHKRECHPEILEEPKPIYACDMCGGTFSSKCNLGIHKKGRCKGAAKPEGVSILETKKIRLDLSPVVDVEEAIVKLETVNYNDELDDPLA